jgi:hypothetical protein
MALIPHPSQSKYSQTSKKWYFFRFEVLRVIVGKSKCSRGLKLKYSPQYTQASIKMKADEDVIVARTLLSLQISRGLCFMREKMFTFGKQKMSTMLCYTFKDKYHVTDLIFIFILILRVVFLILRRSSMCLL